MSALPPLIGKGSAAWHTLLIAGLAVPGICTVKPKKGFKVDKKAGLGEDGGTTTLQGRDVPSVGVTIRVWTQAQLEQLAALLATLFPASGPAPDPFQVSHPVLSMQGITALFFETVDGPHQTEPGLWEVQMSATEFRAPRSVGSSTLDGATGAADAAKTALGAAIGKAGKGLKKLKPPKSVHGSRKLPNVEPPGYKPGSWY